MLQDAYLRFLMCVIGACLVEAQILFDKREKEQQARVLELASLQAEQGLITGSAFDDMDLDD
jgi:hypothetical protein